MKPRPIPILVSNKPDPQPQIAMLLDRDVLQKMPPGHREFLTGCIGSFVFLDFCHLQITKVEDDIKNLALYSPFDQEKTAKLSEDTRLLRRFWTDLSRFAEEIAANNRAQ